MSLTKKLLGAFGLMLALVLILSAGALLVTRSLNRDLDRAAKVTARKQYLAGVVAGRVCLQPHPSQGTAGGRRLCQWV